MAVRTPSQHKKASRKTISCENCRARKVRCSRESPCQHCTKRGEDCVWKADAHPLVRHTKGHTYSDVDGTTLHKAIDVLATRLTMSSEEIDELIRSFSPSASPSESGSASDRAHSPTGSPGTHLSFSPRQDFKSMSPTNLPFFPPLPPATLSQTWNSRPIAPQQPSFTMPNGASASTAPYASSSEQWPPSHPGGSQDQLMSYAFSPPPNLVLPQATTPSAFPPTMNGYFEPLPLGMGMAGPSSVQALPGPSSSRRESEATFNNWLTTALGSSLGGPNYLPARPSATNPVLSY